MKKIITSALTATLALGAALSAEDANPAALLSGGKVSGEFRAYHILNDKTNTFTPEEGSAYSAKLKYVSDDIYLQGLKAGAAFYVNGDTGLTDWDDTSTKKAKGLFIAPEGETTTLLGEAYIEYKSDFVDISIGRQKLDTPLTKIKSSTIPNFYEAGTLTVKPMKNLAFTVGQVTSIAYGSRTVADFGLIGEKTGTAGLIRPPLSASPSGIPQAEFLNMGSAAGVDEIDGINVFGLNLGLAKGLKVSAWNYYAEQIANIFYTDVKYVNELQKGTKLILAAQYLREDDVGKDLAGTLDYNMYGVKAKVANKKYSLYVAFNRSGDGGKFLNPWGSDPAYTSSLFSRNVYRQDVSAYKVGGHYGIMKGLKLIASYADYGKSQTKGWGSPALNPVSAVTDATEANIILAYKPPVKGLVLKIMNAFRTSEYDGARSVRKSDGTTLNPVERKMAHTRFIANYKF